MKKALLVLCAIIAFSFGSKAQSFEGTHYGTLSITWEQNTDLIIEKTKAAIDENKDLSPAQKKLAKGFAKNIVKNQLEALEIDKVVKQFPDGEFTFYSWIDGEKNSQVTFCPELGRIILNLPGEGKTHIVFPKLGIGCTLEYAAHNSIQENYAKIHVVDPSEETTEINGIPCVPAFQLFKYSEVGGEMVDTVTFNNELCVKVPADGYVHADYQKLGIKTHFVNEYGEQELEMQGLTVTDVDDANFILNTEGIEMMKPDKLAKQVKKLIKDGKISDAAMPFDGNMPAVVWDIK